MISSLLGDSTRLWSFEMRSLENLRMLAIPDFFMVFSLDLVSSKLISQSDPVSRFLLSYWGVSFDSFSFSLGYTFMESIRWCLTGLNFFVLESARTSTILGLGLGIFKLTLFCSMKFVLLGPKTLLANLPLEVDTLEEVTLPDCWRLYYRESLALNKRFFILSEIALVWFLAELALEFFPLDPILGAFGFFSVTFSSRMGF